MMAPSHPGCGRLPVKNLACHAHSKNKAPFQVATPALPRSQSDVAGGGYVIPRYEWPARFPR